MSGMVPGPRATPTRMETLHLCLGEVFRGYIFCHQFAGSTPSGDPLKIPAVFITLNRELWTDQQEREVMEVLRADGVPAKHVCLPPLKLEKNFFATRIGEVHADHSSAMVDALKTNGLLQDGFLTQDPRRFDWKQHLAPLTLKNDSLAPDQSAISEVLNCAWGVHEMTRDGVH